jgi:hypothetical protein
MTYHGAFDDWLAAGKPGYEFGPSKRPGFDPVQGPFWAWLGVRERYAHYRVQKYPWHEPDWQLIAHDSYRDFAFKRRDVFIYQLNRP